MANIGWGLQMSVLGMGLVFALLALLWGLLNLALFFDRPAVTATSGGDAQIDAVPEATAAELAPQASQPTGARAAAILIAVVRHRQYVQQTRPPMPEHHSGGASGVSSNWLLAGRIRQNKNWQPGGKR